MEWQSFAIKLLSNIQRAAGNLCVSGYNIFCKPLICPDSHPKGANHNMTIGWRVLWPKTPDFMHTDVQIPMTAIPFYVARRNLKKKLHKSPKMSNDNALHITPLKADVGCQSGLFLGLQTHDDDVDVSQDPSWGGGGGSSWTCPTWPSDGCIPLSHS